MSFFERWGYRIACMLAWTLLLGDKKNSGLANVLHDLDVALSKREDRETPAVACGEEKP